MLASRLPFPSIDAPDARTSVLGEAASPVQSAAGFDGLCLSGPRLRRADAAGRADQGHLVEDIAQRLALPNLQLGRLQTWGLYGAEPCAADASASMHFSGHSGPLIGTAMTTTTHTARITGPVAYLSASGRKVTIPLGPCMVECTEGAPTDIVWGTRGQSSVALPMAAVQAAQDQGHLVLLD